MKKIFYLSTCDTCKRILKEIELDESIELQDIKKDHISEAELELAHTILGGSYELLLNKRSNLYQSENLKNKNLTEYEIKNWILKEYTLLKRPLAILDHDLYAGNAKNTVESLKIRLA